MARNMPKGVHVAPLLARFLAWLIDASVPALLGVLMWFLQPRIDASSVLLVVTLAIVLLQLSWGLLLWWGYGARGAGVGYAVMGLQLVGIADGRPIGWWRFFLRQLVYFAVMATIVGGVFMLIFLIIQERHQGWHDLAAASVAIKAREKGVVRRTGKSVAVTRRTPSTTVALPPHLVARAFDGTADPHARTPDPGELALQAATYGGGQTAATSGWQPPTGPRSFNGPDTGRGAARVQAPAWNGGGHPAAPSAPAVPGRQRLSPVLDMGDTRVRPRRLVGDEEGGTHLVSRPPSAPRAGNEGWFVVLDDGRQVDVTGLVVIGRKPTQPVGSGNATLVTVGEGAQAVSKNHLQVGADGRGLWISDTGSTNGTAVVNLRGDLDPCQPGLQVRVREGQVVSFGDRTLTVRRQPYR